MLLLNDNFFTKQVARGVVEQLNVKEETHTHNVGRNDIFLDEGMILIFFFTKSFPSVGKPSGKDTFPSFTF